MRGMAEGCADVTKGKTDVTFEKLWALNVGIDRLFSLVYEKKYAELFFGKNRAMASAKPTIGAVLGAASR